MWYKAAQPLVDSGQLAILGVVQEQHAERALLYRQWKQFDFPIAQDATTQLNLDVVPIPLFIDEYGVVQKLRGKPQELASFVKQKFEEPAKSTSTSTSAKTDDLIAKGNMLLHKKYKGNMDEAIKAFSAAAEKDPANGKALFSLGVAQRMRYDHSGDPKDFADAAKNWKLAMATNPNQYIWRRRLEQYGPRLTKPYPFYDWVDKANDEIKSRGDSPVALRARLTGTETASPRATKETKTANAKNPDPKSEIAKDENQLSLTATCVPAAGIGKNRVRVHLHCNIQGAKWNHEAPPIRIWIDESSNGTPESRLIEYSGPKAKSADSDPRCLDFEMQLASSTNDAAGSPPAMVRGYVLFHSCDDDGVCFYYRKDFELPIGAK